MTPTPMILAASVVDTLGEARVIGSFFSAGVAIVLSALLLLLVLRSGGKRKKIRLLYACCELTGGVSSLLVNSLWLAGLGNDSVWLGLVHLVGFCAWTIWPFSFAVWWDDDQLTPLRRWLGRFLLAATALVAFLVIAWQVASLWFNHVLHRSSPLEAIFPPQSVYEFIAHYCLAIGILGVGIFLPGRLRDRSYWIPAAIMVSGLAFYSAGTFLHNHVPMPRSLDQAVMALRPQGGILAILGALFYFARFRASDLFVRLSLRILVGAILAVVAASLFVGIVKKLADAGGAPGVIAVLGVTGLICLSLIVFQWLSALTDRLVERLVFGEIDYRQALKRFQGTLSALSTEREICPAAEQFLTASLRLVRARVPDGEMEYRSGGVLGKAKCSESNTPTLHYSNTPFPRDGEDRQIVVPILSGNQPTHFIIVSRDPWQRILFSSEVSFVQEVSRQVGDRLDEIRREQERLERARREAELVHQVVQSELRALRAQVNPHFLFNSLNTIAALIIPEPSRAEEMTVRLAKIFRHVLTHADRPFSSVEEEMSFLHTYLEIEKVRFGERLKVRFEVKDAVSQLAVPTLILQPLVENALKHGLAPKVGETELTIRADRADNSLLLCVEDNGVGLRTTPELRSGQSTGVGLRNVQERLQTVYGQEASFLFEARPQQGSRAIVQIPIERAA